MIPKFQHHSLYSDVAMATPFHRTVYFEIFKNNDGSFFHEIHPVLAIRSYFKREYAKKNVKDRTHPTGVDHAEMIKLGWHLVDEDVYTEGIVVGGEFGLLVGTNDASFDCGNRVFAQIVVCLWPEGEDEFRFKEVFEKNTVKE